MAHPGQLPLTFKSICQTFMLAQPVEPNQALTDRRRDAVSGSGSGSGKPVAANR
jgi:hypothetical protein